MALVRRVVPLTLVVALASLLALLGAYHWSLDLFSHFVLHYAIAGTLCAVALAWLARPRWAMLAALVALLNAARLFPYWEAPAATSALPPDAETIGILQFNVQSENRNIPAILDWLKAQAAQVDILVLLEVTRAWKPFQEQLAAYFPHSVWKLQDDYFGIATLTRLPTERLRVDDIGGFGLPSVVMKARTPRSNQALTLYATHPPPPRGELGTRVRDRQLSALAAQVSANPDPIVLLVGDLNATIWSTPYERLVARTGLRDAQAGFGYNGTWPASLLPAMLGIPIDHTLVSRGLLAVLRTTGPSLGSDHYPVFTRLALRP